MKQVWTSCSFLTSTFHGLIFDGAQSFQSSYIAVMLTKQVWSTCSSTLYNPSATKMIKSSQVLCFTPVWIAFLLSWWHAAFCFDLSKWVRQALRTCAWGGGVHYTWVANCLFVWFCFPTRIFPKCLQGVFFVIISTSCDDLVSLRVFSVLISHADHT